MKFIVLFVVKRKLLTTKNSKTLTIYNIQINFKSISICLISQVLFKLELELFSELTLLLMITSLFFISLFLFFGFLSLSSLINIFLFSFLPTLAVVIAAMNKSKINKQVDKQTD